MEEARQFWSSQLALVRSDVQRIKDAFFDRCKRSDRLGHKQVFVAGLGAYTDNSAAANEAVMQLEGMVASALLDVSTTLPILISVLHQQVNTWSKAGWEIAA